MADRPTLVIVTPSNKALCPWVQRVVASWPGEPPMVDFITHDVIADDPASATATAAVVLVIESSEQPAQASKLIRVLAEYRRLTARTTSQDGIQLGEAFKGSVAIPHACDPTAAAAVLASLAAQGPMVNETVSEIRLLNAHRGGLSAQVSKLDEELRLAAEIQREFLPVSMPCVGPISTHAMWRPAGYVSGDLYDAQQIDEHHIGFFIADAVGHGVPAALLTVYIKRSLQTKDIHPSLPNGYRILDPGEALGRLNDALVQQQNGKVRFCTAAYGIIDVRTGEVQFARAGHPYPILLRHDGSTETMNPDGGLLGVFPDETFETHTSRLLPGDRFLLYSDGFEMAFPRMNHETGKMTELVSDDYTDELEALREGEVDEALLTFCERLDQQAGSLNQRDDLTVLCVSVAADAVLQDVQQPPAASVRAVA